MTDKNSHVIKARDKLARAIFEYTLLEHAGVVVELIEAMAAEAMGSKNERSKTGEEDADVGHSQAAIPKPIPDNMSDIELDSALVWDGKYWTPVRRGKYGLWYHAVSSSEMRGQPTHYLPMPPAPVKENN